MAGLSGGPEVVGQAIVNTITTYLNGYVTTVNGKYSDYQLPAIPATAVYLFEQDVIPEYPAIVVSYLGTKEPDNGAPNWSEDDHRFDVTLILTSDTKDSITRASVRYLWCLWELFKQHQPLDGTLSGLRGIDTPDMGRSPVYSRKSSGGKPSGVLMIDVGIEVVVHVIENTF
jgi:hypothetical protein